VYRSVHPYVYYHLAWPEEVAARQIRDSERIDTEFEVMVDNDFDVVGDWPKPALLNNLSKSGARVLSTTPLGSAGHELVIKCTLTMSDVRKDLALTAIIRNVSELTRQDADGKSLGYHVY